MIGGLGYSDVIFSTLNYDLLFEISALAMGLKYNVEPERGVVRLLKPLGSSNFLPDTRFITLRNVIFENCNGDFSGTVVPVDQQTALRYCREEDSLSRAMAMYAEGKSVKVCRRYLADQQMLWQSSALAADRILISGVRVHQPDWHIRGGWHNAMRKSLISAWKTLEVNFLPGEKAPQFRTRHSSRAISRTQQIS